MQSLSHLLTAFALFLFSIAFSFAQNQTSGFCSSEPYTQFDFWEGNWKVYDTKGTLIGTNKLVKMQNNCVMQENWESKTSPNKGTSYNYYNKADETWNQVWVDNSGFVLTLKGRFKDGKMVLESPLQTTPKGNFYNRLTWYQQKDQSVIQIWERLNENKQVVNEVFRGIYRKNS